MHLTQRMTKRMASQVVLPEVFCQVGGLADIACHVINSHFEPSFLELNGISRVFCQ
jgi:hypothetical protein